MPLPRFEFKATPVATTEDGVTNERRYRAEVERAFRSGDMALVQIEKLLAAGGGGGGGGAETAVGATPPASPSQGQLWFSTVEPVGLFIWYEDGDSAQWVQIAGGGDGTTTGELDIVLGGAEWQVVGDHLLCWGGNASAANGVRAVTFPRQFKSAPPCVLVNGQNNNPLASPGLVGSAANVTANGFDALMQIGDPPAFQSGLGFRWLAIGEALDADKMPKSIQLAAGVAAFATVPEARAGLVTDKVMSPALVQALSGMQRMVATGLTTLTFNEVPGEANELDLIIAGLTYPGGSSVRLDFAGAPAARMWSSRVNHGSVYQAPTGEDDATSFLIDAPTNAQGISGLIKLSRDTRGGTWGVTGTFRRSTVVMFTLSGVIGMWGSQTALPRLNCNSAFTGGDVAIRWRI